MPNTGNKRESLMTGRIDEHPKEVLQSHSRAEFPVLIKRRNLRQYAKPNEYYDGTAKVLHPSVPD